MRSTPDAGWHQAREHEAVEHVRRLLDNPKFVIDTLHGQRSAAKLKQQTVPTDRLVDLKRVMAQHRPDRAFEATMPVGRTLTTTFSKDRWWVFRQIVGRLVATVYSPTRPLLDGEAAAPMTVGETRRAIAAVPPPLGKVPTTLILVSTSGFDVDARELAERTSEHNVLLVEPTASGGWAVHGSTEIAGIRELLNPETDAKREQRLHQAVDDRIDELSDGSLAAEKLAMSTELPLQAVEDALKSYAKRHPGLVAKRFDGRLLLYREGVAPQGKAVGGEGMSLADRIKILLNRKGDHEKKIAYLAERRAALTAQRDLSHDELFKLEKKESGLKQEFRDNDSPHARRRVTTQLTQLRKEIERRHQLLSVVNQQVNIVGTHLHNLELLRQGKNANLPDTDEIANDAAAAEDMLATLQADSELADGVSAGSVAGLSSEEQAVYDELMATTTEPAKKSAAAPFTPVGEPAVEPAPPPVPAPRTPQREPG